MRPLATRTRSMVETLMSQKGECKLFPRVVGVHQMHDAWWQQLGGSCQNSREHVISLSACTSGLRNYWNFCHKTCSRSRMRGHITCEHRPIHLLNCPVALHLRTCDMIVLPPLSRVQYCAFPSSNALPNISWGLTLRGDCEACGAYVLVYPLRVESHGFRPSSNIYAH